MVFQFKNVKPRLQTSTEVWGDWKWQLKSALKTVGDFQEYFHLDKNERSAFESLKLKFKSQTTPYYASLADAENPHDPIRKILMPTQMEANDTYQSQFDPLGERVKSNRPTSRIVHRYSDRVLFLVTDMCSVYCRFCTRKNFTAQDSHMIKGSEYDESLKYIENNPGVREVILSGGDPLTLGDGHLERILFDLRKISHVEIIRIHTRMPVVTPMRITEDLAKLFRKNKPVYVITHFNHPKEITVEAAMALETLVDHGTPVLNQMVLLNGINNHEAIVQALSRRLLYLRVKPYYMFQCDPSEGSDHLRTSIDDSLEIQKNLWGHLSGLAMPSYIVDLPNGGGKVALHPDYQKEVSDSGRKFTGWDGVDATYVNPGKIVKPFDYECYLQEWEELKSAKKTNN